jgi:uncharacterized protein (DUF305 family)
MRTCLLALVAAVLLAACSDPAPTSTTTGAQTMFNDADVRFLQAMIPHHQQAIDAAKLVAGRTHRSQMIKLADAITASQPAEIQTMKGWLQRWQQPVPATGGMAHEAEPAPGIMNQGQLDWLATLHGLEFDLGFTTSLKTHHLGAIKMASSTLQEGRSSEVRMLATQILTAQQDEVDQLTQWHDAWSSADQPAR